MTRTTTEGGGRIARADPNGKEALTRFRVIEATPRFSWIEAQPVTGRTHQIRVHCARSGHPIVGDDKYGNEAEDARMGATRLMLHAASLVFPDAEGNPVTVEAPPDEEFDRLKKQYLSI